MKSLNTKIINKDGIVHLEYPIFDELPFIIHGGSTRYGGVSKGYYSSMNLGLSTDDDMSLIKENWRIFCECLNVDINKTVCSNQQHEDNIKIITEADCGKGIIINRDFDSIDGLVTNCKEVALCVFSADCIPVLFVDSVNKVIGAAHCGWRGTYLDLAAEMVFKMADTFGSKAENIKVAIGAGIRSCCYEVDSKLYNMFKDKYGNKNCFVKNNKYYLDLQSLNKQILEGIGVKDIFVSDLCTCCNKDELFSHRGSGGKRGLMVNLIQMK